MKVAQIKKSWRVYPPNYKLGDKYFKVPFLKDAWNKARSLGVGAKCRLVVEHNKRGWSSYEEIGGVTYIVK